ncbi:hypothetical protein CANMA_004564 [Candida margitis]|uniref:uncharacterized protein n=1 Tax=Candida margitis TaxID=1775924 RepID=UPI0022266202|nr:uncharacterized protein CANMA_004546 [Candida margitis]XP_051669871.1 uncharacterized protein CANMA_004564 [Candida margitis]KAI5956117.1 hypothetical protein CANMA_004546 [Candida margitis]KAI5956135.1 hypothetical protein CANMA_004564 [Candida margitis]
MTESPATIKRKRHTNSKLGCLNCKRKKIRCDESLPSCKNCLKGKKDTCSYLSLPSDEIEKIKLTHSLRNSQNKLLNSNYRLPATNILTTSRNEPFEPAGGKKMKVVNSLSSSVLDFKFELADLPVLIPSITYPPLQYNNLSMQDFTNEFKVMNDFDSDDYTTGSPTQSSKRNILPNGFEHRITFKVVNPRAFKRVDSAHAVTTTKVVSDYSLHLFIGKNTLFDYMSDLFMDKMSDQGLSLAVQCIGEAILLNHLKNKPPSSRAETDKKLIGRLENRVRESFNKCCQMLESKVAKIQQTKCVNYNYNSAGGDLELAAYTGNFLTFNSIISKQGVKTHFNTMKLPLLAYNTYSRLQETIPSKKLSVVSLLKKNLQYNVISANVPSYNPQFLFEIESNLRSLEFIFTPEVLFKVKVDSSIRAEFETLKAQYSSLMKFLKDKVLNIIFALRDESSLSVYPIDAIYDVLSTWHAMCPPEALVYKPKISSSFYDESVFLKDLSTTLYTYYSAIAAALDAVFPSCKYLFSLSFILPVSQCYSDKETLTVSKYNPYTRSFFSHKIDELLQRHIIYASRLYAFFKRRFVFYHNNIKWSNYYDNATLINNRSKSRKLSNATEVAIKSFNTTLIRPEHYPIRDKSVDPSNAVNNYISFTREDDPLVKNLYARNIETLNIFDETSILQFDYESMLLLKDYRSFDDESEVSREVLSAKDIRDHYEDRITILDEASRNW